MSNYTIENGKLTLNLYDMLSQLSTDDKLALADDISCMDDVIDYVASQIVTGYTPQWSHGSKGSGLPRTPLERAQDYIADNVMDIARYHVKSLKKQLERAQESLNRMISKQVALERQIWDLKDKVRELGG